MRATINRPHGRREGGIRDEGTGESYEKREGIRDEGTGESYEKREGAVVARGKRKRRRRGGGCAPEASVSLRRAIMATSTRVTWPHRIASSALPGAI